MSVYHVPGNAVIEQAAKDYSSAIRGLIHHTDSRAAADTALELNRFFHSGWDAVLSAIDSFFLIDRLRKGAEK